MTRKCAYCNEIYEGFSCNCSYKKQKIEEPIPLSDHEEMLYRKWSEIVGYQQASQRFADIDAPGCRDYCKVMAENAARVEAENSTYIFAIKSVPEMMRAKGYWK